MYQRNNPDVIRWGQRQRQVRREAKILQQTLMDITLEQAQLIKTKFNEYVLLRDAEG